MVAHIRTIKPDFFKDENIAELSYPARLLFIGLWCQADREGRIEYRPKRIKVECLPYDDEDVTALINELVASGFLAMYSVDKRTYLHVRTFHKHQRINTREPESELPAPRDGVDVECTHMHAHADTPASEDEEMHTHARTLGREGKGREGKGVTRDKRAAPLPVDFAIDAEMGEWARVKFPSIDLAYQTERFRDYFTANGKVMKDWRAAWRNWIARSAEYSKPTTQRATRLVSSNAPYTQDIVE